MVAAVTEIRLPHQEELISEGDCAAYSLRQGDNLIVATLPDRTYYNPESA